MAMKSSELANKRDCYKLSGAMGVAYLQGATVWLILPLYFQSLKISVFEIGVLMSISGFAGIFSAPISGRLSDYVGRKPLILLALAGYSIPWILFRLTTYKPIFYVVRIIDGITLWMFLTVAYVYVADVFPSEKRGTGMGIFQSCAGIGMTLGPIVFVQFIYTAFGFEGYFVACALLFLVAASLIFFIRESNPNRKPIRSSTGAFGFSSGMINEKVRSAFSISDLKSPVTVVMIALAIYAIGQYTIQPLLPLYLASVGLSVTEMSLLFSLGAIISSFCPIIFGRLSDRVGRDKVLIGAILISGTAFLSYIWVAAFVHAAVVRALTTLGFAVVTPVGLAFMSDLLPISKRGTAIGIYQSLLSVETSAGGVVGGAIALYVGYQAIFVIGFIAAIVSAVMVALEVRRIKTRTISPVIEGIVAGRRSTSDSSKIQQNKQ